MKHSIRKAVIGLLLTAALAFPAGAFAAQTTGSTPETLTVASTISATFPAATTYGADGSNGIGFGAGPNYETPEAFVTIVGSNNPTGVTITAQASVYDGPGAIEVATTGRKGYFGSDSAGSGAMLTPTTPVLKSAGTWATPSTVVTIASSTGALAGRKVSVNWAVAQALFTVGGEYTSSVTYVASTNP